MIDCFLLHHPMVIVLESNMFYFNILKLNTSTLFLTNKTTTLCFAECSIL